MAKKTTPKKTAPKKSEPPKSDPPKSDPPKSEPPENTNESSATPKASTPSVEDNQTHFCARYKAYRARGVAFVNHRFSTDDLKIVEKLKKHPAFGNEFWVENKAA